MCPYKSVKFFSQYSYFELYFQMWPVIWKLLLWHTCEYSFSTSQIFSLLKLTHKLVIIFEVVAVAFNWELCLGLQTAGNHHNFPRLPCLKKFEETVKFNKCVWQIMGSTYMVGEFMIYPIGWSVLFHHFSVSAKCISKRSYCYSSVSLLMWNSGSPHLLWRKQAIGHKFWSVALSSFNKNSSP